VTGTKHHFEFQKTTFIVGKREQRECRNSFSDFNRHNDDYAESGHLDQIKSSPQNKIAIHYQVTRSGLRVESTPLQSAIKVRTTTENRQERSNNDLLSRFYPQIRSTRKLGEIATGHLFATSEARIAESASTTLMSNCRNTEIKGVCARSARSQEGKDDFMLNILQSATDDQTAIGFCLLALGGAAMLVFASFHLGPAGKKLRDNDAKDSSLGVTHRISVDSGRQRDKAA
jgi:hypothetical protein